MGYNSRVVYDRLVNVFLDVASLIVWFLSVGAIARAECSKEEAMQAEATASQLKDWNEVYDSYRKYSHCDDGAIAEGYSESISQLLATKWDLLNSFEKVAKKDKKFKDFVIKHIDQTMDEEARVKILDNATKHCPSKSNILCKRISGAAKSQ